ncbi:PhzF family phenazine biosynthesis protein [Geosporobacter ferrireducens]|uniref:PhzF family phenazine biosynthesis protein n=1 Tax=Geosporobacter ferrireducens TaxID=1424294 RepID=UPI00139DD4A8|nr:PhzF family phenazine biosynthesis protein [Geosporobacter ferrireducens]MTI56322.1 PhzF family phenazine biosynthesis protein [Geosporobacter ferrireducens]
MRQYVVDAFTDKVFGGNPAAVCIMDKWLTDETMMQITRENNLSETTFVVKEGTEYKLRWFTPGGEIDLCGHATLATAYVITRFIEPETTEVRFQTLSGLLTVIKNDELFEMDFPSYELKKVEVTEEMVEAIGIRPLEAFMERDLLCILESEDQVRSLNPNQEKVKLLDGQLLHVTAQGKKYDCVSRSFAPKCNVQEDPVCGSGHCHIIPFWANRLGKNNLVAYQASQRSGTLYCEYQGARVKLSGKAVLYSTADINF